MNYTNTPFFRAAYPHLFKPKMNDLNGKEEYSLVALFPKGCDLTELKTLVVNAITEKWGEKSKWPANLKSPFRDQGEREKIIDGVKVLQEGYEAGAIFINLKSNRRPGVVNQQVKDILDHTEIYSGCWCRAQVSAFAYDQKGNRGVAFNLIHVQKVKDDESISGRTTPQEAFAPIVKAGDSAPEPSNALDLFS